MVSYANNTTGNHANDKSASAMGADLAGKAAEYASRAGEKLEKVVEGAEQTARNVADQGRVAGEQLQEVAGNVRTAVDKSVREQPMATLAVAAALGFVIGAVWKS